MDGKSWKLLSLLCIVSLRRLSAQCITVEAPMGLPKDEQVWMLMCHPRCDSYLADPTLELGYKQFAKNGDGRSSRSSMLGSCCAKIT